MTEAPEDTLEALHDQARHERTARLLALTARGTTLVFSDQTIDSIALRNKKQEATLPVSIPPKASDPLQELIFRANTWINSLSAAPESLSPQSEPLSPESQEPIQEPLP